AHLDRMYHRASRRLQELQALRVKGLRGAELRDGTPIYFRPSQRPQPQHQVVPPAAARPTPPAPPQPAATPSATAAVPTVPSQPAARPANPTPAASSWNDGENGEIAKQTSAEQEAPQARPGNAERDAA